MLSPQDFLNFVELDEFIDDWKKLGLDDANDLFALQIAITVNPKGSPVIESTGGLRKLRFAPQKWHRSKRGSARICYVYYEEHATVILCTAYSHSEKDNLSPLEKKGIKEYIEKVSHYLSERKYR